MIDLVARATDGASGPHDVESNAPYRTVLAVFAFAATGAWGAQDVFARPDVNVAPTVAGAPAFPTQYSGFRLFDNGVASDLCLVALADAPAGPQLRLRKGATTYAVYLVETTDGQASPVRVRLSTGTKAIRWKT